MPRRRGRIHFKLAGGLIEGEAAPEDLLEFVAGLGVADDLDLESLQKLGNRFEVGSVDGDVAAAPTAVFKELEDEETEEDRIRRVNVATAYDFFLARRGQFSCNRDLVQSVGFSRERADELLAARRGDDEQYIPTPLRNKANEIMRKAARQILDHDVDWIGYKLHFRRKARVWYVFVRREDPIPDPPAEAVAEHGGELKFVKSRLERLG